MAETNFARSQPLGGSEVGDRGARVRMEPADGRVKAGMRPRGEEEERGEGMRGHVPH